MGEFEVLVMEDDTSSSLAKRLCDILNGSGIHDMSVRRQGIRSTRKSDFSARADSPVSLMFLVAGNDSSQVRHYLEKENVIGRAGPPVIATAPEMTSEDVIEFFRLGISDFVTAPLRTKDVVPRVQRWQRFATDDPNEPWLQEMRVKVGLTHIVGRSPRFKAVLKDLPKVAKYNTTVLITGETGTGKEVFARAIHYLSPRAHRPFVPVNCGAIPVDLIENELFGHERGAFTSANANRTGLLEEAEGGTLFLDEINALPMTAQVKLLRFLQEKEYRPLGSSETRRSDVRVLAAANENLFDAVMRDEFRQDLYFRLKVVPVDLPPLRDRVEDIPLFAEHFTAKYAAEFDKPVRGLTPAALAKLETTQWPGNVRELEYVIERAVIMADDPLIQAWHLQLGNGHGVDAEVCEGGPMETFKEAKARVVTAFERRYLQQSLEACRGNISEAARLAGKNRRALFELIRRHGIEVGQYRQG